MSRFLAIFTGKVNVQVFFPRNSSNFALALYAFCINLLCTYFKCLAIEYDGF